MKYIDIISDRDGAGRRMSHLTIEKNGKLSVSGNLPHGYEFEPMNIFAAEKHIEYLQGWVKQEELK